MVIIHTSNRHIADYLKQYIRERKITGMQFNTRQQEALTTGRPDLMVIFPDNRKYTDDAVAAARLAQPPQKPTKNHGYP